MSVGSDDALSEAAAAVGETLPENTGVTLALALAHGNAVSVALVRGDGE